MRVRVGTKHLRDDPVAQADGTRIYVGRLYPRGVKDGALWNERMHALGPSRELHQAALHDQLGWASFSRRYLEEMEAEGPKAMVEDLARRAAGGEVLTLLCDHPRRLPADHCHRFLLATLVARAASRLD